MAKFRMIHTAFWDDPKVVEELTPEDKYFFLYLLTNSNTRQIGIYQITKKQMAFDLGYSMESVNSLLDRFINHEIVQYNPETREIAIRNWGRYNLNRGGKPMLDCVNSELKDVKDETLINYVGERVERDDIREIYESYNDTLTNRFHENDEGDSDDGDERKEEKHEKTAGHDKPSRTNTSYDTSTIRGQEEEEEEEEEYKDRVRDLFDHFVSKKIIQHKKMTSAMRSATKARLRDYTYDDLIKAIDNYALVYFSNNHWFTHKYPFADFMRDKDIRKFLEEADPVNNFMQVNTNKKTFSSGIRKEDFDLS